MTTRATVTILTPADRQKVCEWAMKTGEGTVVTFRKKSRSSEQSAKMWAMLHEVAEQVVWYGQKLDADSWKDIFTASLRHARVVPGIDKGTFVPLGMHTSTMTIEEMGNLIELIYSFGAEHDVVFKDPKPNEQQNTVNDPPPSSTVSAESISADEAGTDDTPMSDVPASNPIYTGLEWLRSVTKHIYRHTYPTDDKSDLEDAVKEAAAIYPKPDNMEPEYSEKAKLVVKECRKIRDKQVTMFDGEEIIAALVEMKPEELGL